MASITTKSNISGRAAMLAKIKMAQIEKNKIHVFKGDKALSDKRFVEELIFFTDPQGNRMEIVYRPMKDNDPFVPGRPISGFKTGR